MFLIFFLYVSRYIDNNDFYFPQNAVRQSPSPLMGRKESSPSLDISEAEKKQRLEKEKSALDALDISTYSGEQVHCTW
jgi:hypothetical protein